MEREKTEYSDKIAHVVYASDEKFSEIMGISIVSLFENSQEMEEIVVYILDNGISKSNKQCIEKIFDNYKRHRPIWITAKNISYELNIEVSVDRGSISQYARLFVSSILPKTLDRVIYLDCDTIFCKSVYELWNVDLHNMIIGALMDAFSSLYRINIDLEPKDIMFNSGVMLIDLKRWRAEAIERKILEFIVKRNGKIQQGDQGVLNAILSNNTYCLEPKFNTVTIFYDFTYKDMLVYRKPPEYYCENVLRLATEEPTIIHFTTSFKSKRPWIEGCKHRYVGEWLEYKKLSPWKDSALWKPSESIWKKIVLFAYNSMPTFFSINIAGFLQAYGRPLLNLVKVRVKYF